MRRSLRRFVRPLPALLLVTAVALSLRLWALGWRVAHQDEARVASWILHYLRTGVFEYNPWIHGPFLPTVNRAFFVLLGPDDFSMRLIVALAGGLLPLTAWLLRDRLRDAEVVAMGVLLALDPLVLYYSRFMRNDVLTVGFMLAAFAFFVRTVDTRDRRHLYAGTALFALAFTTKEAALLYPVTWVGAGALLLDYHLLAAREQGTHWATALRRYADRTLRTLRAWRRPLALALLEFFAIVVFFYAPRAGPTDGVGLWKAFRDPTIFPAVVVEATYGSWEKFVGAWGGQAGAHPYIPYVKEFLDVMGAASLPLVVLAAGGFLLDRYTGEGPRDVVAFTTYWGVAWIVGFPYAVDNPFPWEPVHIVVPLAVPAAVGLGYLLRRGARGVQRRDVPEVVAAALLVLLVVSAMGATAYDTSFERPQGPDNTLVQYAQPAGEMQPVLRYVREYAPDNDGVDVLFYGELFHSEDPGWPPGGNPPPGWWDRLPLPWYFDAYGATVASTTNATVAGDTDAPVVVAPGGGIAEAGEDAGDIEATLRERGYHQVTYQQYQHSRPVVFFVKNGTATGS